MTIARITPTSTPLGRALRAVSRWLHLLDLRVQRICAVHALRSAEAYGDRDGWAPVWRQRIARLDREIENT